VRVVFPDKELGAACNGRRPVVERWGDAADDIALALCALRAARSIEEFATLPTVSQEDDFVFDAQRYAVHLDLTALDGDGADVAVIDLRVEVSQP
jgi:hypothetical protein